MQFVSTRIIVSDIHRMATFYEHITDTKAEWLAPVYVEIKTQIGNIALGSESTVKLFSEGSAKPRNNTSPLLSFLYAFDNSKVYSYKNSLLSASSSSAK